MTHPISTLWYQYDEVMISIGRLKERRAGLMWADFKSQLDRFEKRKEELQTKIEEEIARYCMERISR